ncbi:AMP-binding protein [Gordonia sp. HNM0687]|uniref:AMP-binding protein n=1 Tax=Gordonia mangrovi TaxID=2665643 RepID=A0A6L7GU26_9ACTN|nr:class I adenylate-forming enzyme family protein [Gordonia mangrovi]MXP23509.1 AMP-binding protein [Gordonia mangrovi]UVF76597.1 acyl--CoA ligase [Gordonia mangrovi]
MSESSSLPGPTEPPRSGWSYARLRADEVAREAGSTVGERIAIAAGRHPARAAVSWVDDNDTVWSVSWREMYARAIRVGSSLRAYTPAHSRVGVLGRDRVQWVEAVFGAACVGYGVVPLPPSDTADDLMKRCGQTGVDLVIATDDTLQFAAQALPGVRVVSVSAMADTAPPVDGLQRAPTRADDAFLFQFTSGTTGTPKVAVLSHRAVLGSAEGYVRGAGGKDGAVLVNPLPLDHVGGSVAGVIGALSVDGTYVAVPSIDPDAITRAIRHTSPDVIGLVPTLMVDLLERGTATAADFASVTSVIGGATRVDAGLIDRIERDLGIRFLVGYGQSEAPCMSLSGLTDSVLARTRTIGRPLGGRDYCIIADGAVVRDGEVGELCVRGPLIMSGYLQSDGTVRTETDSAGWMRTGDLCSMADGIVTFHSRLRDVVIRGGENLYPAEIEPILADCESVGEVSVFGLPDQRLGERLVAAVRPAPDAQVDVADLQAFAAERLPRKKQPAEWFVVDDFPRTSTGKIRKSDLARRLDLDQPLHGAQIRSHAEQEIGD